MTRCAASRRYCRIRRPVGVPWEEVFEFDIHLQQVAQRIDVFVSIQPPQHNSPLQSRMSLLRVGRASVDPTRERPHLLTGGSRLFERRHIAGLHLFEHGEPSVAISPWRRSQGRGSQAGTRLSVRFPRDKIGNASRRMPERDRSAPLAPTRRSVRERRRAAIRIPFGSRRSNDFCRSGCCLLSS